MPKKSTTWGGRFSQATDKFTQEFSASVDFDRRLYRHDIDVSIAHAETLREAGALSAAECRAIRDGLKRIRRRIEAGDFEWKPELEDVHMNIEAALVEDIGVVGKKLHTARSRNDQVATDLRLYLREAADELLQALAKLQSTLLDLAERELDTIMPGYTHLQVAQPISFGHHMLAWNEMLQRDAERMVDCRRRIDVSPLGAAALAGASWPIDPDASARRLGFAATFNNSLDAVSDRDFAIEYAFVAALLMVHLSRMAEEVTLWNSQAFGFVSLDERVCTGSSIMPQKKNPDLAELVRGKSARALGDLQTLMTLMKSQPLAYNRDNQEDKEPMFDAVDTARNCVRAFGALVENMRPDPSRMRAAAEQGYSTATDLADYLTRKGTPFRSAHELTGKIVSLAIADGIRLQDMPLERMRGVAPGIDADVFEALRCETSLAARAHRGAAAPKAARKALRRARRQLDALSKNDAAAPKAKAHEPPPRGRHGAGNRSHRPAQRQHFGDTAGGAGARLGDQSSATGRSVAERRRRETASPRPLAETVGQG